MQKTEYHKKIQLLSKTAGDGSTSLDFLELEKRLKKAEDEIDYQKGRVEKYKRFYKLYREDQKNKAVKNGRLNGLDNEGADLLDGVGEVDGVNGVADDDLAAGPDLIVDKDIKTFKREGKKLIIATSRNDENKLGQSNKNNGARHNRHTSRNQQR